MFSVFFEVSFGEFANNRLHFTHCFSVLLKAVNVTSKLRLLSQSILMGSCECEELFIYRYIYCAGLLSIPKLTNKFSFNFVGSLSLITPAIINHSSTL